MGGNAIQGRAEVVDATPVEALNSDSDARWGFRAKNRPFYGYKISVISDFKDELPIALEVSPANRHENKAFKPLVNAARKRELKASRIGGDAIHDNKSTRD